MKNEANKNEKPANKLLIGLAFLAALVILLLILKNTKPTDGTVDTQASKPPASGSASSGSTVVRIPDPEPKIEIPESEEEPETNAITAWLVDDFRDPDRKWDGYKFNNLKVTSMGVELADGASEGTLETPPLLLKQPSNLVAPLWKQDVPQGASIKVEAAISGDNQTWSDWYPIEDTGNDINPVYPDGTPNPNYGFVPGSYISTGLHLAPFMKYRVVMSKSGGGQEYRRADGTFPDTLRLAAMRVYHLDSSWGGTVFTSADQFPPGPPKPGEEPPPSEPETAP